GERVGAAQRHAVARDRRLRGGRVGADAAARLTHGERAVERVRVLEVRHATAHYRGAMDIDLTGRTVAITGASSGIGEATALACAQAGAHVALAARRADRIEALARRIESAHGVRALAHPTDVGEEAQARAFVERAQAELGRLDVLVNNAGVMLLGPVEGAPTEEWRRMIHANLFGVLYCTHAALPLMRA